MNTKANNVYIQNFWYVNNYGACLTAYALYTIISDQVFRPFLTKDNLNKFLFDYVNQAKKIAFSASFGVNKEKFFQETSEEIIENMKNSLKSFDFISVREQQGVEICQDIFGVNAEWIIDPVFILNNSYYYDLSKNLKKPTKEYIASCIFEKKNNKLDKFLSKKHNCKVFELHNSKLSIEEWLNKIANCRFLVTNSYHAMCFAIIFNKPFIALSKDMGASSRFDSLFEMLGIENQSIDSIDEIYQRDCVFKVDWEKVNKRIEEERKRGIDLLQMALDTPCGKFKEKQEVRTKFLEETICKLEQQATLKYQIKKELWNLWLIIFHKYLPEPIKNIIRVLRGNKDAHRK